MKFKLLVVATVASFGLLSSAMAAEPDQGHGKITFTGSIIDAPCSIRAGDEDQTIKLGSISNVLLVDGGSSQPKSFSINLENCAFGDPATKNKVDVTFTGAVSGVDANLLGITGSAKGAGVAMTAQGGAELIKLGVPTKPQTLANGGNTLAFAAYLQGEGGNLATIKEGAFQAVTDFRLNYN